MSNNFLFSNTNQNMSVAAADLRNRLTAYSDQPTVITLEPGTYTFDKPGTLHKELTASGTVDAPKDIVFDFSDMQNLVFDGRGSSLVFRDRLTPFVLQGARNVTLKNFDIDFTFSRYCQGTVTESDEQGFTLYIDSSTFGYDVDEKGHINFHCGSASFSTESTTVLLANEIFGCAPWDYIFAGDYLYSKENLATGHLETDAVRIDEDHVRFIYRDTSRRPVYEVGSTFLFCYEPRENVNIFLDSCENIQLENINIYRGGGMGIVAHTCRDITCDGVKITMKPGRNECRSTTADGMYFVQCSGKVTVRNCEISATLDDALNIHGIYTKVVSQESPNVLIASICFDAHKDITPFAAGAEVAFSNHITQCEESRATVVFAEKLDGMTTRLTLDRPVSPAIGDFIECVGLSAEFLFENNYVSRCPHLRISGPAAKVIRGNKFEEIYAVLVSDLMAYWFESGCVHDMLIEGNSFKNCPRCGDSFPIVINNTRGADVNIRHENIRIVDNVFDSALGNAVSVELVRGLTIKNNRGVSPNGLQITNCENVEL